MEENGQMEQNLEALCMGQGELDEKRLRDLYQQAESEKSNICSISARDGSLVLIYQKDGKQYRLNSAYRPAAEAEKWAAQYSFSNLGMTVIFYGLGNGMFLRSFLKRCREDTRILVYEPDPVLFVYVLTQYDMQDIFQDKRVSILSEPLLGNPVYQFLDQYVTLENVGTLRVYTHPGYEMIFPDGLRATEKEIEDLKGRLKAAANTKKAYGKRILRNTLYGLKHFADSRKDVNTGNYADKQNRVNIQEDCLLCDYQGKFKEGLPAVIISSGPSLSKSVEGLQKLKGHAVLFAVDSSLRFLLNRGITPDYVVTVDPLKWPKHFSNELCREIPVFCRFDSNRDILRGQSGRLIFFSATEYPGMVLKRCSLEMEMPSGDSVAVPQVDTGGSVATAAFAVCRLLGFQKIILVGQDLCYSGNKTHVGGIVSSDEKKQGFGRRYIPGNEEEKVLTRQDWYRYLKWFENEIQLHPDLEVINATAGGAKIAGARRNSLEQINEICGETGRGLINKIEDKNRSSEKEEVFERKKKQEVWNRESFEKKMVSSFSLDKKEFLSNYLRQEAGKLQELLEWLSLEEDDCYVLGQACRKRDAVLLNQSSEENRRIEALNKYLEEEPLYYLMDLLLPEEEGEVYQLTGDGWKDQETTYQQLGRFYQNLQEAAGQMLPWVQEVWAEGSIADKDRNERNIEADRIRNMTERKETGNMQEYKNEKKILALIPARSGSKSVPHKNIRPINGKPMLAYSIEHAKESSYINRIIVSTDSGQYAGIARQYGAETPFIRPKEYATDTATDLEVFTHCLQYLKEKEGYVPDIVVQLRPTYPIRNPGDIDRMVEILLKDGELDSVRSIAPAKEIAYKMWHKGEDGKITPIMKEIPECYNMPRQQLPKVYYQNACIDVVRGSVILEKKSMNGDSIYGYEMAQNYDIDTEEEFKASEDYLKIKGGGKRFVFDIDGVIAQFDETLRYDRALPNKPMVAVINKLYEMGNEIVLHTARGYVTGVDWEEVTKEQLSRWGLKYHELHFGKPNADYYIDDKMLDMDKLLTMFS